MHPNIKIEEETRGESPLDDSLVSVAPAESDSGIVLIEHGGVGALEENDSRSAARRMVQAATGGGIDEIINEAIVDHLLEIEKLLNDNDSNQIIVNLMGFSRGGATALMIANSLAKIYNANLQVKINLIMFDPVPGGNHSLRGLYQQQRFHELSAHLNSVVNILALNETVIGFKPIHFSNMRLIDDEQWPENLIEFAMPGLHGHLLYYGKYITFPDSRDITVEFALRALEHFGELDGLNEESLGIKRLDDSELIDKFSQLQSQSSQISSYTTDNELRVLGTKAWSRLSIYSLGAPSEGVHAFNLLHTALDDSLLEATSLQHLRMQLEKYKPARTGKGRERKAQKELML